jgi:two-component system, chemotaxis family, CheB/CheR fusion protein
MRFEIVKQLTQIYNTMSLKKRPAKEKQPFASYVVGIGASAGGLEAINEFFENTPPNTGFTFVLVQHLSPDHKSLMVDLLSKHTSMKVVEAVDDTELEADVVYILPSKKFITVNEGAVVLHDKVKNNLPNNAIDVFFHSLAVEHKAKAVGIILSGTGTDGTKGLESIKKNGGIAIVQDPISASFDGMPNSAIAAGLADLILAPEQMASELLEYLKESSALKLYQLNSYRDEFVLRDILMTIRRETGQDFSYYKRPTLFRRLSKRLLELNIPRIKDYLEYISTRPKEIKLISQDFLINVTYFFRDKQAFDIVQHSVIPNIMKDKSPGDTVKVWSVACSSGEEAYSLAILFHEYIEKRKLFDVNIKIFATDIDKEALDKASKGLYPKGAFKEVSESRIHGYFTEDGNNYRVNPEIRKMIVFSYHDMLKDPPFSRMDLVTCRNMLIYVNGDAQREIIRKIHFSLNIDGYLFLGPSEHVGPAINSMQEIDKKWRIYKNVAKARPTENDPIFSLLDKGLNKPLHAKIKNPLNHIPELFKEALLEEYKFAGIFIDINGEVKQATGNYKDYIDLPDSGFNFHILKLVPPDLGIPLNVAIRKAAKDKETVSMRRIKVDFGKTTRNVNITVKPYLKLNEYQQEFLFIILSDDTRKDVAGESVRDIDITQLDRVAELENELRETKENLQAVIEEIEAANEELQSTNEEMVSTNEELQSTNEELQSLNEELHTVSSEHQTKIKELMELNDDLNNYFNNTEIGQILIDRNLLIRRFSPSATRMVNLIEGDLNRSIVDITTRFNGLDFITDIRKVMKELKAIEREVHLDDEIFLLKIAPYVRADKSVDGVVVNFIDITETQQLSGLLGAILNSSPSSVCATKAIRNKRGEIADFEFISVNKAFEHELGVKQGTLIGKRFKQVDPDLLNEHFTLFKEVLENDRSLHYESYNETKNAWFDISLVKLMDGFVLTSTDISERKKAADLITQSYEDLKVTSRKLRSTNIKLEQSNMDLLQFASVASHDLKEPLRKIQTFGNLLVSKAKGKLDDSESKHLEKIISASGRMQKLIEDVLTLSKLSNADIEFEEVDLNKVVSLIKEDLEITVKEKNASIEIEELPLVNGVMGQIHQVFQNLIGNALKFTNGKKPDIKIAERQIDKELAEELKIKPERYYCVSVKDNGIGFENVYKDKIFGIFQRLNGNNYEGTGIGLAICKKIVENHNGHITAKGKLGEGTEVFVLLPKIAMKQKTRFVS